MNCKTQINLEPQIIRRPTETPSALMKLSQHTSNSLTTLTVCLLVATVTSRAQTVTNSFTNPNLDFVNNGIIGSGFDGVDLNAGDMPHGSGTGTTLVANSGAVLGDPG